MIFKKTDWQFWSIRGVMMVKIEGGMARISEENLKWIIARCDRDGGNIEMLKEAKKALELKERTGKGERKDVRI